VIVKRPIPDFCLRVVLAGQQYFGLGIGHAIGIDEIDRIDIPGNLRPLQLTHLPKRVAHHFISNDVECTSFDVENFFLLSRRKTLSSLRNIVNSTIPLSPAAHSRPGDRDKHKSMLNIKNFLISFRQALTRFTLDKNPIDFLDLQNGMDWFLSFSVDINCFINY
jgi:hypothetical protein